MDYAKYLQGRATQFAEKAAMTTDATLAQNFRELAMLCRQSAERLERREKAKERETRSG